MQWTSAIIAAITAPAAAAHCSLHSETKKPEAKTRSANNNRHLGRATPCQCNQVSPTDGYEFGTFPVNTFPILMLPWGALEAHLLSDLPAVERQLQKVSVPTNKKSHFTEGDLV